MIAPLAISEQREAIMSTFEYRPTPNVAAKKLNALTITDCIDAPKADVMPPAFLLHCILLYDTSLSSGLHMSTVAHNWIVPITIPAINGSFVPVNAGIPMLMKIANSITATKIIGKDIDLNTHAIIKKIAPMDTVLTTLKSWFVIVIKSFVQGASPISIAFLSYFFIIFSILSH